MKKLLLIASLMMVGLSGCYVVPPHRGHDDGYRNDRDHHRDDKKRDHDYRNDGRDGGYR
ncbi:MAG: hypothetical protein Q8O37_01200 [Sulfuricellaceae bacterium]|nr:hypothetical protein [Sulfuricellaceae bacterium]